MRRGVALALATAAGVFSTPSAQAAEVSQNERFTTSDGVELETTLTGEGPLEPRPVIVEFSPYGRDSMTIDAGPDFNHLLVQIRGTGDSDGSFDALGPRTQADIAQTLGWACEQPWSNGRLGLNGFSASAITVYNSLHLELPCVETAVLKSGTFEVYRDLLVPGGISNTVPGAAVLFAIGAPAAVQGLDRIGRDPLSSLEILRGLLEAGLAGLTRGTLDDWWSERGFRGDSNDLPILMVGSFFDVESRGAFQGYQELRDDGSHMIVVNAHDAAPGGTDAAFAESKAWFDHNLNGVENGIEDEPRVKLWLADGDREDFVAGNVVRIDGDDWPIPGTRWQSLALDPAKSGTSNSPNDGTLSLRAPTESADQSFVNLPTLPTNTDIPNAAIVGAAGLDALSTALPIFTDMTLSEPLGLSYTTAPLRQDVVSAGPASLELRLSTTAPETGIWVVVSDVSPDGTAHPVATGRLSAEYPKINRKRSLTKGGQVVQPYGRYDSPQPAQAGEERLYRVELWPIGNRFKAGHSIRLHIVGASAASLPSAPGLNTVTAGGPQGSRFLFPVLPGSNLKTALGGKR
ncbi:MAG TPA: CocE/NonD family hydrolase [Solirubrobacterales bacterium]|nr:CocE/NonD family hydrolase [Solirubrobacterales bacterium]